MGIVQRSAGPKSDHQPICGLPVLRWTSRPATLDQRIVVTGAEALASDVEEAADGDGPSTSTGQMSQEMMDRFNEVLDRQKELHRYVGHQHSDSRQPCEPCARRARAQRLCHSQCARHAQPV